MADTSLSKIQALTFDVFGTVVDWHGSVIRALKARALQTELQNVSDEGNRLETRTHSKQTYKLFPSL